MHNGAIMPTEVRHLVDTERPYPVVRLTGVLDDRTAEQVRSVLLRGLAEQPEALIVDVSQLQVPEPAAAQVLAEVADVASDWPGAPVVLCTPPDNQQIWQAAGLPVWPTPEAATSALGRPDPSRRLSLVLEPVLGAARRSRELVTEACARWDLPELIGPACIVVTELVNNVVAHARTTMTVRLALRHGRLCVAVQDGSAAPPRFAGIVSPSSYGGRGLLLIDSVARRWGSLTFGAGKAGKVVWAILHGQDDSDGPGTVRPAFG